VIILKTKLLKTTFLRIGNVVALFAVMFLGVVPQLRAQTKAADHEEHIRRIEAKAVEVPLRANEPPLQLSLKKLMELYKIPALSIAVIENYKIVWVKAYGATDAGTSEPVTTKTLFQAGSISKPVAAVGALSLVEKGKLALDENVNQKLKSWRVPENEFTKTEKVTLRRIMSHTAGLTIHGFPGYDVDAPVPTLVQIFDGEKPANTEPIRVDLVPGTQERYSGGGITIEQQLVMDVTGKPFPEFMRANVLEKIGMMDSSYAQPLPAELAARAAAGTFADGKAVHGRWHIYPEMAAAGLWTTPTDLAKFAIEVARSEQGKANHLLSEEMTKTMLTPVMGESGLGFFLDKRNPGQFGHGGADEGFQALLTMNANSGNGVAIMANSDNGNAAEEFLIRRVAEEYGWKYDPGPRTFLTMLLVARAKGIQAALQRYTQLKKSGAPDADIHEATLNTLGYTLLQQGQNQDAIAAFQRNVHEYPQSSNVYDSLGEAYMKTGQKDLAITNYEMALQLDPKNKTAPEALKKLKVNK
jgi:CubicO group peptidase (beta-lactamase class C family)